MKTQNWGLTLRLPLRYSFAVIGGFSRPGRPVPGSPSPKEVQYRKDDGYWYADLRLDETPQMRECMEQRDVEYILLLKSQGKLMATEPQADKEILQAEQGEWKHPHQFHDEIFATMAAARKEVEIFGKELSEVERKAKQEEEEAKRLQSNR